MVGTVPLKSLCFPSSHFSPQDMEEITLPGWSSVLLPLCCDREGSAQPGGVGEGAKLAVLLRMRLHLHVACSRPSPGNPTRIRIFHGSSHSYSLKMSHALGSPCLPSHSAEEPGCSDRPMIVVTWETSSVLLSLLGLGQQPSSLCFPGWLRSCTPLPCLLWVWCVCGFFFLLPLLEENQLSCD